ncbi:MAG: Type secretion-associated serine protease mycosin [Actinomycetia bacterium]|nr:Type secretion-associated serine protease mycosin [Actinomycetes bacterium]
MSLRRCLFSVALLSVVPASVVAPVGPGGHGAAAFAAAVTPGQRFTAAAGPAATAPDPHSLLVRFKPGVAAPAQAHAVAVRGARIVRAAGAGGFVKVATAGPAESVLDGVRRDPSVAAASLDYRRTLTAVPSDPLYPLAQQPYLATLRLPQAWDTVRDATSQVVAIVDSGVQLTHPDLAARIVPGYNVLSPGSPPTDADPNTTRNGGHGTMVAGIAAAHTNNGRGIAGAAWATRIMPIKVFPDNLGASDSDVATGIVWAADHGATVINLSLGGPEDDPALHAAVQYATTKGALVVAAAGNDGAEVTSYPAAYPEVLAVAATDSSGSVTSFSTHGAWVDVAAPGMGIVSTIPKYHFPNQKTDIYASGSGTSFSAPLVSGIAALVRTKLPALSPAQVLARIKATARDAGPRGLDHFYGAGVVDAARAVGGPWGAELPQPAMGANEPNDVPDRATPFTTSVTGTFGAEGDTDWYRFEVPAAATLVVTVTGPKHEPTRAQNANPVLDVYDPGLRLLGHSNGPDFGTVEKVLLRFGPGRHYVSVHSLNGAVDTRPYTVAVAPASEPAFTTSTLIPGGPQFTAGIVMGDVTGDGLPDAVTAGGWLPTTSMPVTVLPGVRGGSFGTPVSYTISYAPNPWTAALAILDLDGVPGNDVALTSATGVRLLAQTADGTLADRGTLFPVDGLQTLRAADLDGDGDMDLIAGGTAGVDVFTREADGTFTASHIAGEGLATVLVAADLDGKPGLEIAWSGSQLNVYVASRSGPAWVVTAHAITYPGGLAAGDVNGDGRADLVSSSAEYLTVIDVLTQRADGTLAAAVHVPALLDGSRCLHVADMNGDGRADVVGLGGVLFQTPTGTLALSPTGSTIQIQTLPTSQCLAIADADRDGAPDLLVTDYWGLRALHNSSGAVPGGEQEWVRGVSPADFATGQPLDARPSVTFARQLDPASVTAETVELLRGTDGSRVSAAVTYDPATRTATLTPAAPLGDNTPYRIVTGPVRDATGATSTEPFTTTFRTTNTAPPAITGFSATGDRDGVATLRWDATPMSDLDVQVIRMAPGTAAPAGITAGTAVYSGTSLSARSPSLTAGTTYTFRIWTRDRTGLLGKPADATLRGARLSIAGVPAAVTAGAEVTVTASLTGGGALAGVPVTLQGRAPGATWGDVATAVTGAGGTAALPQRPAAATEYRWQYRGGPGTGKATSAVAALVVRTPFTAAR